MSLFEEYDNDTTPSSVVAARYRAEIGDDESDCSVVLLHYRGGQEEFELGSQFVASKDPLDRVVGADILGELGWGERTFLEESMSLLLPMLDDPEPDVIQAANARISCRKGKDGWALLVSQGDKVVWRHPLPNAPVRWGVAVDGRGGMAVALRDGTVQYFHPPK